MIWHHDKSVDILNQCWISVSWTFYWIYIFQYWAYWSSIDDEVNENSEELYY